MRYRVIGSDEHSRRPVELLLEAADEAAARRDASARGVIVRSVQELPAGAGLGGEALLVRLEPGHVQLIERTGKLWKGLLLASALLVAAGLGLAVWMIAGDPRLLGRPSLMVWLGVVLAAAGLIGLVAARAGAWWFHG
ncbi:MAG: hypothetical protein SFZ24_00640 [Planctomycetota bacterium]|nr:hypothetical protein [Planctomycetota bacterium]